VAALTARCAAAGEAGATSRAEAVGLVVAVLVGAGLVLVSAAHYAPKWDGVAYLDLARSIASGRGMSDANGTVDHHAAPLWPAFIAAVGGDAAVAGVLAVAFL